MFFDFKGKVALITGLFESIKYFVWRNIFPNFRCLIWHWWGNCLLFCQIWSFYLFDRFDISKFIFTELIKNNKNTILARNEEKLKENAQKCLELGAAKAIFIAGDISSILFQKKLLLDTVNVLGKIDFLVCSIGNFPAILQIAEIFSDQ